MTSGGIDPILYSKYHHLQEKEVNDFLLASADALDWGNLTRKIVMDIGCGPGNTSCAWFLSLFPAVKRLIAIDISEGMISLGRTLNPHPKIEYMVADITDESSVECWEGTINKAISTWCLQFVTDQEKAFKNIYRILKPGGAAAILFEVDSPYHHHCYQDITRSEKWNAFFKNVGQERVKGSLKNSDDSHYKQLLQDMGFNVILCKRKQRSFTFSTDDDCTGFLLSTFPEHKMIPENLMEEFRKDLLLSLSCGSNEPNGRPTVNYNVLNVLIRKPNSPN